MNIKPIIDRSKPLSDGKYRIKIYVYIEGKKAVRKTKYAIEEKHWDDIRGAVIKSHPNHLSINSALKKLCLDMESQYLRNEGASVSDIVKPKITFEGFMKEFVDFLDHGRPLTKTGQPLSPAFTKSLKNSIGRVLDFVAEGAYNWEKINMEFYSGLVNYLRYERDYNENTIARVIKDLKYVLKIARKRGHHSNSAYEDFTAVMQDSHSIALTPEEIERFFKIEEPLTAAEDVERDRFYVAYNFLLRFTDSIVINEMDIVRMGGKTYLNTIPSKTKDQVIVPFLPRTESILKKYNYKIPHAHNQVSNRCIKRIGELAGITEPVTIAELRRGKIVKKQVPKYKLITTHTCRRSMATNLWKNGFDLKQIQLLGGWKTLTSLQKYLRVEKEDNARAAANHPFFN